MQAAKTNAERTAQIAERKAKAEAKNNPTGLEMPKLAGKAKAKAAPKAPEEKAIRIWTLGEFTGGTFRLIASSFDHNSLEARAAPLNKAAKTRVAFVVDAAVVGEAKERWDAPAAISEDDEDLEGVG